MVGPCRVSLGVLASLLLIPSVHASNGCLIVPPMPRSYYWPAGDPYGCPSHVKVIPVGNSCEAVPIPPPPRQTTEPPMEKKNDLRAPIINSTRSLGGSYSPGPTPASKERCQVGFWNLTGRDVTLTIDGKSWPLPKNRKITVELEYQFIWQADRGAQQVERVPDHQATHEVAVRD